MTYFTDLAKTTGEAIAGALEPLLQQYFSAQDTQPFPYIPKGVSTVAQQILSQAVPVGGPVKSPDHWEISRAGYAAHTQAASDQAKEAHIASSSKLEIEGVPVFEVIPKNYNPSDPEKILIYIHGGGYTLGSTEHLYQFFAPVADKAGLKTFSIDYPLAPENPFPAAGEACFKVYQHLLTQYGAKNIFLLGDSAGGTSILTTLLKAREKGLEMPAGICLLSPFVEAEKHGPYYSILDGRTPVLDYEESLLPCLQAYAPDRDPAIPEISPINAENFHGFPPTFIQTGSRDLLADNCYRLHEKMEKDEVSVQCRTWYGMGHNFQMFNLPEAERSCTKSAEFFRNLM